LKGVCECVVVIPAVRELAHVFLYEPKQKCNYIII
jgi:hypothetical protein